MARSPKKIGKIGKRTPQETAVEITEATITERLSRRPKHFECLGR